VKDQEFRDIPKQAKSFYYNGDDSVIKRFLEVKVEIPFCARCDSNLQVSRWGWYDLPTVGKLQVYYCKPCNYEFMDFPHDELKKEMPRCPKCREKRYVAKWGMYHTMRMNIDIQYYHCSNCSHEFQRTPKMPRPDCLYCSGGHIRSKGPWKRKELR